MREGCVCQSGSRSSNLMFNLSNLGSRITKCLDPLRWVRLLPPIGSPTETFVIGAVAQRAATVVETSPIAGCAGRLAGRRRGAKSIARRVAGVSWRRFVRCSEGQRISCALSVAIRLAKLCLGSIFVRVSVWIRGSITSCNRRLF
jgi:hypothetical protein